MKIFSFFRKFNLQSHKIKLISVFTLIFSLSGIFSPAYAYVCKYKEDYWRLYHIHHQQLPDDVIENIYWLEKAVNADFANPQYAIAKIKDETEWEKYRYLFQMHINLKLVEQHLRLGRIYDKQVAYFYDAPWKEEYLRDLEKALSCYKAGYYYWQEAKLWAEKAGIGSFRFLTLTEIQNWEDEKERIKTGELNYQKMLDRECARLENVIQKFKEMDTNY